VTLKPVAAITGASSGIGEAFARKLSADYDLLLIARSQDRLEALARDLRAHGAAVSVFLADLSDVAQLKAAAERLAAEPRLALLVNNAGFGNRAPFWEADVEVLDRMHRLHIGALVRLSHAALQVFVPHNRGAIINVASVAAFARRPGSVSYGATKTWVNAFTEGLYVDLRAASSRVYVQALCPGYTYSEFHDVLQLDRRQLAPPSMWLTAETVVDESLRGMRKRKLYVVPGWRYQLVVALLRVLPGGITRRATSVKPSAPAQRPLPPG
jgi:short-subunit dehydrogenase